MDLKEIRQRILSADEVSVLYEIELDLTEHIGQLHIDIRKPDMTLLPNERIIAIAQKRAELGNCQALLNVCKERQPEVKNKEGRMKHNFWLAAKTVLKKETYQSIMNLAVLPRYIVKGEEKALKADKME